MGTVTLCTLLPYLVFGLLAGSVVDMVDRKRVMVWSNLLRGMLTLAVPGLVLTGPSSSGTSARQPSSCPQSGHSSIRGETVPASDGPEAALDA